MIPKPRAARVPAPYLHKPSGQSAVVLRDSDGKRRTVYLGVHGSAEAGRRYREVLADYLSGKAVVGARARRTAVASSWPTVGQLCADYLLFAARYYVGPDGKATREVENATASLRMLLELHRETPTDQVRIADLIDVRQAWIDLRPENEKGRQAPNGLSRRTINDRMQRTKSVFRWGVEKGMVPGATWSEVQALRGLPKGRSGVHDNPPVEAVPWKLVEEILPHLVPTLRDAVLVQWWCGARPGELLAISRRQLDMSADPWLYRVGSHKGTWRGKERVITLGPKAQELLRPRLRLEPDAPLFSGRVAWEEHRKQMRAARTTPPTKQMRDRDLRAADRQVEEFLTVHEYRRGIHRACDRANVPRWSPHRLRHACGTRIAQEDGIEAARAYLGHADSSTTRRYALAADTVIAAQVAKRRG